MPPEPIFVNLLRSRIIDSKPDGMVSSKLIPEPLFVNVYRAQESLLRNDFVILCSLAGRYDKSGCRTGPPGWESIPGLLKRFTNMLSGLLKCLPIFTSKRIKQETNADRLGTSIS
jgi:hypothetical protein